MPSPDPIAEHIAAIAGRSRAETEDLVRAIVGHAWPAGAADGHSPVAAAWLQRWRPERGAAAGCDCCVSPN